MANILLNISNFDAAWAYRSMENYLHPGIRVLILPLSYQEGWIMDREDFRRKYGKGGKWYEELVRPFRSFGIKDKDIAWINSYEDTSADCKRKIREADVLFFTGGYPDWAMQRIEDLGIAESIRSFKGTVMGCSAGAMIQLDTFHVTPEEDYEFQYMDGLGLISGFDIDVHYEQNEKHLYSIIRTLEDTGRPVVCMPNDGGMILDEGNFELLGHAFVASENDLDDIYATYEDSKQLYGW